ncbi:MAG: hypothetical protein ACK5NX_02045 [Armatimonadota bacterium]
MSIELLERLEPTLDTAAITGGNPMHRVLLVANVVASPFTGWARLAVDFQTRRRYAIRISDASSAMCRHSITDEIVSEPNLETGKFRWAFTLRFKVNIEPNQLVGFLAAWTPEPDQPETSDAFSHPDAWLPALEAHSHPGPLTLPHTLPGA